MKRLPLFCSALSLLALQPLFAQSTPPADKPAAAPAADKPAVDESKKAAIPDAPGDDTAKPLPGLEKMTVEQQKTLIAGMGEVANYLRGVRWQEALSKLSDMETACGESHYISNLRGAVYTRMRDFAKARVQFTKALELSKGLEAEAFHPKFNLAELDFVEKKFDDARTNFTKLLTDPGKPANGTDTLIKFKLLICDVQQKKTANLDQQIAAFDQYDDNSPAYYYAQAAKFFGQDKKDEANEWLESARKIYAKEVNEVYDDSFVEMGWLETLQ